MRRLELFFLLLISFPLSARHLESNEVVFLFDIHDVFLEKTIKKVTNALWKHKYHILDVPALASLAKLGWIHLTDKEITSDEFIQAAIQQKSPGWAQLIKDIANAQEPIEGTVEIIKALHDKNYRLHIGSNIGSRSFRDLTNKKKHPKLAKIFRYFDLPHSQISVHTKTDTIKKPQARFYKRYLLKNRNPDPSTIIFIDDMQENIDTAKKLGFETIHFKNPDQLRTELVKRGFTFLKKEKS